MEILSFNCDQVDWVLTNNYKLYFALNYIIARLTQNKQNITVIHSPKTLDCWTPDQCGKIQSSKKHIS